MSDCAFTSVAPYYDALMSNVPYDMWADYIEEIFEHLRVTPRRILDIATGTGSVAILLAERGYQVTGVDLSAPMLEQARRKARERVLDLQFLQRDAAELSFPPASFDAAICLYDSFNYLLEPARLQSAFDGAATALAAGGPLIFDLNTVRSLEQELFTQQSLSPEREVRYSWRSRWDAAARLARVDMEFWADDGVHFEETHYQRGYTEAEVTAMLERAGFILEGVFEAYTFLPAGPRTERAFYVAGRRQ
ncbi:MAG TPA: class I SAM-dependent methyltransferase [Armatimonadota bacterium]|nr:class I SAM-dependent methyltransferase [Armatimonadota bacterium]